jgi:hypothetical protein
MGFDYAKVLTIKEMTRVVFKLLRIASPKPRAANYGIRLTGWPAYQHPIIGTLQESGNGSVDDARRSATELSAYRFHPRMFRVIAELRILEELRPS